MFEDIVRKNRKNFLSLWYKFWDLSIPESCVFLSLNFPLQMLLSWNFQQDIYLFLTEKIHLYYFHLTRKIHGFAHNFCNWKVTLTDTFIRIAQKFLGFDFHLLIKGIHLSVSKARNLSIGGSLIKIPAKTSTLNQRWNNVDHQCSSTLFQHWHLVENESWADEHLSTLFQRWQNNVEETSIELRWFNVDELMLF